MQYLFISLAAAALLIAGLFLLGGIHPREYGRFWLDRFRHKSHATQRRRRMARESTKSPLLIRYFAGARAIMRRGGHDARYPVIVTAAVALATGGVLVSLTAGNVFLAPVLALGLLLLPFAVVYSREKPQTDAFNRSMKTALGVVTNTYIQTGDIIQAVESSREMLQSPFSGVFAEFLGDTGSLGPSVPAAIRRMMAKVDDNLFREWCRILIQCQDNQELRYTLPLVVKKIDDTIQVQAETDTDNDQKARNFKALLAINLLNLPLMALIEPSWLRPLVTQTGGQLTVALAAAVTFGAVYWCIHALAPVRYK